MNILALDLGSTTGYAFDDGGLPTCGSTEWATKAELSKAKKGRMDRRCDVRVVAFAHWLRAFHDQVDMVVFEDVEFIKYRMQAQLWASYRTAVWLTFPSHKIECVSLKTLKKFAGHGGADKDMMRSFLVRKHPELFDMSLDDNAIDATWLWLWAKKNLGRVTK